MTATRLRELKTMTRSSGMPVGADVRERLRAAQRAESDAIAAVQKAEAAEADVRARLEKIILKHQAELSEAGRAVGKAQAVVVRISGLERAATLLDVHPAVLKSAVKKMSQDAIVRPASVQDDIVQAKSNNTPAATTAPTVAPTKT